MKKIRLVQVLPSLATGGAERMVVQLMNQLDRDRFDVAVVSLHASQGTQLEELLRTYRLSTLYLGKRNGFDPRVFGRVNCAIKVFGPHIVHTHLSALNYAIPAIVARLAKVFVHTIHGSAERQKRLYIATRIPRLFERAVVPVAVASEVQASISRVFRVSSVLIPNGIPVESYRIAKVSRVKWRVKEQFEPDDFLFASVGRLDATKNHSLLIRAFATGPVRSGKAHLVLAGEGGSRQKLIALVKALNLQNQVHFLGDRPDIPDLLAACDVFVSSSVDEGRPLSVMEAMAAGLPIVGTAVGGIPEMAPAGRVGILVRPGDLRALATAMCKLQTDATLRSALGKAAARHAVRFDLQEVATDYAALYASLLAGRGHTIRQALI